MKIHVIAAAIACSTLFGCATSPRFSEAEFPRSDADIDILASQQEIDSETSVTNAGAAGGGLLGVLISGAIDNTRNDRAEEAILPFRDYLIDYDLSDAFVKRIQESGVTKKLVVSTEPVVRRSVRPPEERVIERPLIIIEPRVMLSNDMRSLMVDLNVWEVEPPDGPKPAKTGVSQSYRFLWPLEGGDDLDRDEAVAAWIEHPKDDLVELIETGMDQTIRMLDTHLRQQTLVFEDEEELVDIPATGRFHLWQQHDDVTWAANNRGWGLIYAVPNHAVN
jgi:hypothetical protein